MENGSESNNFLKCQYQNIAEVVNLKCEKCHEKLKYLLKSLSTFHLNGHKKDSSGKSIQVNLDHFKTNNTEVKIENSDSIAEEAVKNVNSDTSPVTLDLIETNTIKVKGKSSESIAEEAADPNAGPVLPMELPYPHTSVDFSLKNEFGMSQTTEKTENLRRRIIKMFTDFIETEFHMTVNTLLQDQSKLEECLIHFFDTFRVHGDQFPKKQTLDCNKSFIKTMIVKSTQNQWDISNVHQFPKFNLFYKNYAEKLGLTNLEPIPQAHYAKMYHFLTHLLALMNGTSTDLSRIPQAYQHKYHFLARDGMIFLLISYFKLKNKLKLIEWQKSDFEIIDHPDLGQCYKRKDNDNDFLPFAENEYGLSVGQYFHDYMSKLDGNSPWLLTKPKINYRKFEKCGLQGLKVWYEESRIGKNRVLTGLAEFFAALDLPQYKATQISKVDLNLPENYPEHFVIEAEDPLAPPAEKKIKIEMEGEIFDDESNFVYYDDP